MYASDLLNHSFLIKLLFSSNLPAELLRGYFHVLKADSFLQVIKRPFKSNIATVLLWCLCALIVKEQHKCLSEPKLVTLQF